MKCIQLFRERLSEKMCTRQSRKVIWDMINTLSSYNDCSCRTYFGCFPLAIKNITSLTFRNILSNFFEEQCTQNYPQYLSGLSRALFPTTFLEIAVYLAEAKNEALVRYFEKCLSEAIQLSPKARARFNFF